MFSLNRTDKDDTVPVIRGWGKPQIVADYLYILDFVTLHFVLAILETKEACCWTWFDVMLLLFWYFLLLLAGFHVIPDDSECEIKKCFL